VLAGSPAGFTWKLHEHSFVSEDIEAGALLKVVGFFTPPP